MGKNDLKAKEAPLGIKVEEALDRWKLQKAFDKDAENILWFNFQWLKDKVKKALNNE